MHSEDLRNICAGLPTVTGATKWKRIFVFVSVGLRRKKSNALMIELFFDLNT